MPYFIEKADGSFVYNEGTFSGEPGEDCVAVLIVSEKISRVSTFKREVLTKKPERRFRCRDGKLKFESEMTEEDFAFRKEKMAKARAARAAKAQTA